MSDGLSSQIPDKVIHYFQVSSYVLVFSSFHFPGSNGNDLLTFCRAPTVNIRGIHRRLRDKVKRRFTEQFLSMVILYRGTLAFISLPLSPAGRKCEAPGKKIFLPGTNNVNFSCFIWPSFHNSISIYDDRKYVSCILISKIPFLVFSR